MAYNKYNNKNNNNRSYGGNSRSGSAPRYSEKGGEQKKHSGASSGVDKNGNHYVRGWNYSRAHGMVTFLACGYNKTKRVRSEKSGKEWENVMVKVSPKMSAPYIVGGMHEVATGRVIIKDLGIIMNPRAPHGGYCGRIA